MKRSVIVRTQYEGVHCWIDAPNEVFYLRYPHRHIFNVEVEVQVEHNDRDIEFIMLKHQIDAYIDSFVDKRSHVWLMETKSCEDVAVMIIEYIANVYPGRDITVSIFEDGENGCKIHYNSK